MEAKHLQNFLNNPRTAEKQDLVTFPIQYVILQVCIIGVMINEQSHL